MRFYNYGREHWKLPMKDIQYGSSQIKSSIPSARMAVIDSGSKHIQIPESEFK